MKQQILNQKYNIQGITLIALIITIIVLLILAGIAIATLTGENGILSKANYAKESEVKTEMKEKLILAILELQTEKLGKVELLDITQEYIDSKMSEYENNVTEESENSIRIEIKQENIVGVFIIDENLNIIEIENDVNQNYYHIITKLEEGISLDNKVKKIADKKPYQAKIIVEKDYRLENLFVTMAGEEIAVNQQTGEIKIESVTGDIEIIATAKKITNTLMLEGGNLEIEGITSTNITTYEEGKFGACYDFTGNNAYMDLGNASKHLGTENEFTIDMWICATQVSTTSYGCLINIGGSNVNGGVGYGFATQSGNPYLYMGAHRYTTFFKSINLNKWHHIALVRNDKTYTTYIDGQLAAQAEVDYPINMNLPIGIGCNLSYKPERFIGYIDKIRITNTTRWTSDFDVSKIY
ncbi:MAG: LamG domain-containing protein [Clostridia bacterium]|nr:LamG domain-containing protein [Clostridia bacterium]